MSVYVSVCVCVSVCTFVCLCMYVCVLCMYVCTHTHFITIFIVIKDRINFHKDSATTAVMPVTIALYSSPRFTPTMVILCGALILHSLHFSHLSIYCINMSIHSNVLGTSVADTDTGMMGSVSGTKCVYQLGGNLGNKVGIKN